MDALTPPQQPRGPHPVKGLSLMLRVITSSIATGRPTHADSPVRVPPAFPRCRGANYLLTIVDHRRRPGLGGGPSGGWPIRTQVLNEPGANDDNGSSDSDHRPPDAGVTGRRGRCRASTGVRSGPGRPGGVVVSDHYRPTSISYGRATWCQCRGTASGRQARRCVDVVRRERTRSRFRRLCYHAICRTRRDTLGPAPAEEGPTIARNATTRGPVFGRKALA